VGTDVVPPTQEKKKSNKAKISSMDAVLPFYPKPFLSPLSLCFFGYFSNGCDKVGRGLSARRRTRLKLQNGPASPAGYCVSTIA
jgi:hypothetical protein